MNAAIYKKHRLQSLLMALTMAIGLMAVSCSESDAPQIDEHHTYLTIHIQSPESSHSGTRADVGDVAAQSEENKMYQTYVWVFDASVTDDKEAVPLSSLSQNLGGVTEATVQLSIDPGVISRAPNLDVFVVANVESIPTAYYNMGPTDPPVNRETLKNLIYGKATLNGTDYDDFGTTSPVHAVESGKGIPMSQYALNQKVINSGVFDRPVNLVLKRAVSKIRFVFARRTGVENVTVTGITLNDNKIPTSMCVFPTQPADPSSAESVALANRTPNLPAGVTYQGGFAYRQDLTSDSGGILAVNDPTELVIQSGESAHDYVSRLAEAYKDNQAALYYGLTYLRETNQKLSGTITYKVSNDAGAQEFSAPFEMVDAGDFTRNHEYIVYAYFEKSGLNLTVTAQPWEKVDIEHEFANTVAALDVDQIQWTVGTYDHITTDNEVILHPSIDIHPTFSFNIRSPKGAIWYAVLRTTSGDPTAFTLCDTSGNELSQGIIDENPVTLCIHAREANPAQNNIAELLFVVRCNGQIIPVTVLSNNGNYFIVQNKNI